jgi:hypothetical protein
MANAQESIRESRSGTSGLWSLEKPDASSGVRRLAHFAGSSSEAMVCHGVHPARHSFPDSERQAELPEMARWLPAEDFIHPPPCSARGSGRKVIGGEETRLGNLQAAPERQYPELP